MTSLIADVRFLALVKGGGRVGVSLRMSFWLTDSHEALPRLARPLMACAVRSQGREVGHELNENRLALLT